MHRIIPVGAGSGGSQIDTRVSLWLEAAGDAASLVDLSSYGHTLTAGGDFALSTAVLDPQGGGNKVMAFDGTGDYLRVADSSVFSFGTGDFAIWVTFRLTSTSEQVIIDFADATGSMVAPRMDTAGGALRYRAVSGGGAVISGSTLSSGVWYDALVKRISGTTRMYLNGTQDGSDYTDSNNYVVGTNRPVLGISGANLSSNPLNGYIGRVAIAKGVPYVPPLISTA